MRVLLVALAVSALPLSAGAAGAAPLCRVALALEPPLAWVDQQVLYRLRIESREGLRGVEWLAPPSLPGLRWERLPGEPDAGQTTLDGVAYRVREEHRAIFPERAGEIVLPEATLRCSGAGGAEDVRVPGARLRVRSLPLEGRPADFTGVVGSVRIERRVGPSRLSVGKSLRLSVRLRGEGNLWDAPDPLAGVEALGSAELLRLEPEQELDRGATLSARLLFRYDVVPHEAGTLRIPELRVAYFDPATSTYAAAVAPALALAVAPAPRSAPPPGRTASAAREDATAAPEPARRAPLWPALTGALLAGLAALVWLRRRSSARAPDPRLALEEAARADAAGDREGASAARARALRAALARHLSPAEQGSPEELLAEPGLSPALRDVAQLLARVERARFDPEADAPDANAVARAVRSLHGRRG